jgi:two-component sensor histidine kinase
MINKVVIIFVMFYSSLVFSQTEIKNNNLNDKQLDTTAIISKIENFIIDKQLDSAKLYLSELEKNEYLKSLSLIINKSQSYSDYYKLAREINNRNTTDLTYFKKLISKIPIPKTINLDYVYTNWLYITKLRNFSKIEEASKENNRLETYIQSFKNVEDVNIQKATLLLSTHQIVLFLIEKNIKQGKSLSLDGLEKAKELNDNTLQVIFINHLCDFLIEERNLEEYINMSELSLSLESDAEEKSPYYIQTLEKLIDAYLYKGGYDERVNELLTITYDNPNAKIFSYSLYANFLRNLDENSPITSSIFNQFEVSNYIEFCNKIEELGTNKLDSNLFYFLLDQCSKLLETKGFLKEAIQYKSKCVILTRKIYSEDLSSSLANYRTMQAVKQKEIEITHEKQKQQLFAIIIGLGVLVLFAMVFVLFKKIKQQKILKEKNAEIKYQRDQIKEKEKEKSLLLKEIHHRVKNNFQIVSSLLELQTKNIEDEKALELAKDGKNRVKSMALIHQKLYQNEDSLINFDEYIRQLVKELTSMYASNLKIKTNISTEDILFDVDTAIPLGLIINELITNAYKYAFTNEHENILTISINKEDTNFYKLVVSDNGPGLKNEINYKKAKSLGLRLVNRLVRQLQGTLNLNNSKGANFEILFKDTYLRNQIN